MTFRLSISWYRAYVCKVTLWRLPTLSMNISSANSRGNCSHGVNIKFTQLPSSNKWLRLYVSELGKFA